MIDETRTFEPLRARLLLKLKLVTLYFLQAMNLVATTIYDIFLNLTPFAGILVVMYYTFAIIGRMVNRASCL